MAPALLVEVQRVTDAPGAPGDSEFTAWANAALPARKRPAELLIRLVDEEESRFLNRTYRGRDTATNVLSFPAGLDGRTSELLAATGAPEPLGDLVICAAVVRREANEQGKAEECHWAHLVVHGVLHLLGFDHQEAGEAGLMESREREILAGLGHPDPYTPR